MSDLLQSQLYESCKLVLPHGLQELMNDISREVLRANPQNLYQFIADYLEALLDARDALSIACRTCGEICSCSFIPELDYELHCIGLSEEDVDKAKKIIQEYFDKGKVKESNLLIKLAKKTSVTEAQLAELKKAVHRAFQRYILKKKDLPKLPYARTMEDSSETSRETSTSSVSNESTTSDFYKPCFEDSSSLIDSQANPVYVPAVYRSGKMSESITTLAGSFVDLPTHAPYSVHEPKDNDLTIRGSSVLNFLKTHLITEHKPKPTEEDELSEKISVIQLNELHHEDTKEAVDEIVQIISNFFEDRTKLSDDAKETFDEKLDICSENSSASL